jgi:hypothetical protein
MATKRSEKMRQPSVYLWCARIMWALLVVTVGGALADALASWSDSARIVATALAGAAWAAGLLALFAPRPWGLTLLRVVAPYAVAIALLSVTSTSGGFAVLAGTTSVVATFFVLSAAVSNATGNALAYGDEHRFLLRIPTPLLLGPVPIAVVAVACGAAAGPITIAADRVPLGIGLCIVGFPIAFLVARSLHALSVRWLVFVPAGIAVVDPLTLIDAVLVRREKIASLRRTNRTDLPAGALDLRLGTLTGDIAVTLSDDVTFTRRRGRENAELVNPSVVVVAAVAADAAVTLAETRRIKTR